MHMHMAHACARRVHARSVHGTCMACAGRVQGVCMLRTLLQRSARVLDRIVRVLQPVGHLLTKQVPREEAQRDAAGARQVEELDLGDGWIGAMWDDGSSLGAHRGS